jgi:hypothetical protein
MWGEVWVVLNRDVVFDVEVDMGGTRGWVISG